MTEQEQLEAVRPSIKDLWDFFLKTNNVQIYKEIQDRMKAKIEQHERRWVGA